MREEYIKCVRLSSQYKATWCGSGDVSGFIDVDHAALNGKDEGRLVVCPECREAIVKALLNGCDDGN